MLGVRRTIVEAHSTLFYLNEFDSLDSDTLMDLENLLKVRTSSMTLVYQRKSKYPTESKF